MEVRLVLKKATKGRNIFRLKGSQATLGRAHGCVVRIPSADVSREHCRIVVDESTVTVQDLGSLNGTLLNGAIVEGVQEVQPGDFLRVGPALFEVRFDPSSFDKESEHEEFVILEDDEEVPAGGEIVLEVVEDPPLEMPVPLVDSEDPLPMSTPDPQPNPEMSKGWRIPDAGPGNLRDLLAHLEEPAKSSPAPKAKKRKKKK